MRQMKKRIYAGEVLEQIVYNVSDSVRKVEEQDPEKQKKERFPDEESYAKFRLEISRRHHARLFNANFSPSSIYGTLTFDDEWEVHTFKDAKRIARNYIRRLKNKYPDAVIFLYMGRGKGTKRIHFHTVTEGIPEEFLSEKWTFGEVRRFEHLRQNNWYDGVDHGQDYTGLANYLFNHWTEEVGGHRWMMTKNAKQPEAEKPTEVHIRGGYHSKRAPVAPKGYKLVSVKATQYGCTYFKYVRVHEKESKKRGRPPKRE